MQNIPVPPYEPDRFATAARSYRRGRAAYPPRLIRAVAEACDLRSPLRALDLGCGPGSLSVGLAFFAGAVLALDPQPAMLEEARHAADGLAPNITFRLGSSYDLAPDWGPFRLAALGRSFHWMDRRDTLRRLDAILDARGAVALFHDTAPPALQPDGWREGWRAIIDRYASDDPERRRRRSGDWPEHAPVLLQSAFCRLETISMIEERVMDAELLIARTLSLSSTSPGRIGEARTAALTDELRRFFAEAAPDGTAKEVLEFRALIGRRA